MSEVNQSVGMSTSKSVNDQAKKDWKGGLDHGSTNPQEVLSKSPTKHPLPVSKPTQK